MLRAKVLPEVLGQIVGDGITACMLMTLEGALVGSVGDGDAVDHKVVGAIASHTWGEYLHAGKEANPTGDLRTMLVELEARPCDGFFCCFAVADDTGVLTLWWCRCFMQHGRLAMTVAGKNFLLCAYSSTDAPAGLLKAKVVMQMKELVAVGSDVVLMMVVGRLWQVETLGAYLTASLDQIEM